MNDLADGRVSGMGRPPGRRGGWRTRFRTAVLAVLCLVALGASVAGGDVITDGTMGAAREINGPRYAIPAALGRQAGGNLFHSFRTFNVLAGESAVFSGPETVRNVISRVTGGGESLIDGHLACTIPGSDLYLLNPHGVIFGENATLDIQGAFHVSTSDYLRLGNTFFSTRPVASELLSAAPPEAFGFLDGEAGAIVVRTGSPLEVGENHTISLIGGDIVITDSAGISAPGGAIRLAGVRSPGEVALGDTGLEVTAETGGEIRLSNGACLDVSGAPAGSVYLHGGRVRLDHAAIRADHNGPGPVPHRGDEDGTFGRLPRQIGIHADQLLLENASRISSGTDDGWAGSIGIRAGTAVELSDRSVISTGAGGEGSPGSIHIEGPRISLASGSGITSERGTLGKGGGGDIRISGCDLLRMEGESVISTATRGEGAAGCVELEVGRLSLSDRASVSSSSLSTGAGGNAGFIQIRGADTVEIGDGSTITTSSMGEGSAGYLFIDTDTLTLFGNAAISSTNVLCNSDPVFPEVPQTSPGDAHTLSGWFDSPGFIGIRASDRIVLDDHSTITSSTSGTGMAGNINLSAGRLEIRGGSSLLSSSAAAVDGGSAGTLFVRVEDTLSIRQNSTIATKANSGGRGLIVLSAGRLLEVEHSRIATDVTRGPGPSGDVTIDAARVVANGAVISARADAGAGGNITIRSGLYLASSDTVVTASSRLGIDGRVEIDSIEPDFSLDVPRLASTFPDADDWTRTPCRVRYGENVSNFVIHAMEGAPRDPGDWQPSPFFPSAVPPLTAQ